MHAVPSREGQPGFKLPAGRLYQHVVLAIVTGRHAWSPCRCCVTLAHHSFCLCVCGSAHHGHQHCQPDRPAAAAVADTAAVCGTSGQCGPTAAGAAAAAVCLAVPAALPVGQQQQVCQCSRVTESGSNGSSWVCCRVSSWMCCWVCVTGMQA